MDTIALSDWEAFEEKVKEILANVATRSHVSTLLFRGQSDSSWRLQTTLERYAPDSLRVSHYYRRIHSAKYQIESLTEQLWEIPTLLDYDMWLGSQDGFRPWDLPGYDYMIYLRHHGFPSPLLDWSRSPYVAAFFAFNHAAKTNSHVSIYAYLEHAGYSKTIPSSDEVRINGILPRVRSHPRHVLQQGIIRSASCNLAPTGPMRATKTFLRRATTSKMSFGSSTFPPMRGLRSCAFWVDTILTHSRSLDLRRA